MLRSDLYVLRPIDRLVMDAFERGGLAERLVEALPYATTEEERRELADKAADQWCLTLTHKAANKES